MFILQKFLGNIEILETKREELGKLKDKEWANNRKSYSVTQVPSPPHNNAGPNTKS